MASAYFVIGQISDSKSASGVSGASVTYLRNDGNKVTTLTGDDGSYLIYLGETCDDGYLSATKDYYVPNFVKCD